MTTPPETINLDDPASDRPPREVGKLHAAPSKAQAATDPTPAKAHPSPAPLTFSDIYGAVLLAILTAAVIFGIVAFIFNAIGERKQLDKELEELHQRARP